MFIPIIPRTTVINKTIVYSDTVLSLKDLGTNLKITTISNINHNELEDCLRIVFESNPNTTFNTIQYSRQDKKLYLYTDKIITTTNWNERNKKTFKPLTSVEEILDEIDKLNKFDETIVPEDTCIPVTYDDAISLYDIAQLLKQKNRQYERDEHKYDDYFDRAINEKFSNSASFIVYGFDYDTLELRVGFKRWDSYDEIRLKKENEDFYVSESKSYYANDILVLLGNTLSNLYDTLLSYKEIKEDRVNNIKPVNSSFLVNISQYGVTIFVKSKENRYKNDFELTSYSYTEDFDYECNSNNIISAIKGNEYELLKKILMNIEDCPKWMQPLLYELKKQKTIKVQVSTKKEESILKKILKIFN